MINEAEELTEEPRWAVLPASGASRELLHQDRRSYVARLTRPSALDGAGGGSRPALKRNLVSLSTRIALVTLMQTFDAFTRR